jgi:hypothetical protein
VRVARSDAAVVKRGSLAREPLETFDARVETDKEVLYTFAAGCRAVAQGRSSTHNGVQRMTTIEERLTRLEAENAQLRSRIKVHSKIGKWVVVVLSAITVGGMMAAANLADGTFDTIVAKKIILNDAQGKTRIILDTPGIAGGADTPHAEISLFGDDGQKSASWIDFQNAADFWLYKGGTANSFMQLSTSTNGNCSIGMRDDLAHVPSSQIGINVIDGLPVVYLNDGRGSRQPSFTVDLRPR